MNQITWTRTRNSWYWNEIAYIGNYFRKQLTVSENLTEPFHFVEISRSTLLIFFLSRTGTPPQITGGH